MKRAKAIILEWSRLKGNLVTGDGCDLVVPQPRDHWSACLDADKGVTTWRVSVAHLYMSGLRVLLFVPLEPACAEDENVSRSNSGALELENGLNVHEGDGLASIDVDRSSSLLGPACKVD